MPTLPKNHFLISALATRFGIAALGLLLVGIVAVGATRAADDAASPGAQLPTPRPTKGDLRVREGTKLQGQLGHFKMTGDRAMFITADGQQRFGGLENLNLARIVSMISDAPDGMMWSVSGTVTEFQGSNYLLISHAVLKTSSGADEPKASDVVPSAP